MDSPPRAGCVYVVLPFASWSQARCGSGHRWPSRFAVEQHGNPLGPLLSRDDAG
jgi:hypothetical protein